jgi:anti-sigma factor ChrR (cupin superfamily)
MSDQNKLRPLSSNGMDVDEQMMAAFAKAADSATRDVPAANDGAKSRIWQSISTRLNAECLSQPASVGPIRTLPEHAGKWLRLSSEIEIKVLNDDGIMRSFLMRVAPGGSIPDHIHSEAEEECLVLEGEVEIDGELLRSGDYQISPKGSHHRTLVSPKGCLLFLRGSSLQAV